ncbi:MAG TPA: hypothetical protein VG734_14025 [Lacunisphaera sp.]|nr:hypothetical protein [Lacunisphaera sp.]
MASRPAGRGWFWAAMVLTALKLWLTGSQLLVGYGPAIHDDQLFVKLAGHIINGQWLGPYDQFTLAKGPLFSAFIAAAFWVGVPLMLAQQAFYAAACAAVTRALAPWVRGGMAQFACYAVLLWNPMSYDASTLSRVMRQNIYTPLALLVIAGLVRLFARRHETWRRQAGPAVFAGASLGCFWLTREESVWLLPAVGLLLGGIAVSIGRDLLNRWRTLAGSVALFVAAALVPILVVCTLNYRYYGWFGTVEFRAPEFKAAYGALTRLQVGPELPQVPVSRQMRERAYELSPAFARLRGAFESSVTGHWSDTERFPAAERQIRGGWFMWALRDAVAASHIAPDAGGTMRFYQQVADELNAAVAAGRVPARPLRETFMPVLDKSVIQPIADTVWHHGTYYLGFEGFSAYSPESIGDYAELKPFRDYVGTRLSFAPRSPDAVQAAQSPVDLRKLAWLEAIGHASCQAIDWLGPLVLLVGLIRVLEALRTRRLSFLLWLAVALLAACAAYFAIIVLIHVTSFPLSSPAAMFPTYALYLLALTAIVADACQGWRPSPETDASVAPFATDPSVRRWRWLAPAAVAVAVFAARLGEIHLFAGDVPYNDQWFIEAVQIIAPWVDGTLRPADFLIPHFEHVPVWTRLLAWSEVVLTGRWDPRVQMTVNAAIYALFAWCAARWLWRSLAPRAAGLVTFVLLLGGALPHAWENIAWGFQSQFPLALLFLFLHVHGACSHPPGSRGWWLAQAAGLAGLLTLASMWLAPLAVVAAAFWVGRRDFREWLAPLVVALLGAGLLAVVHFRDVQYTFAHTPVSPMAFLTAAVHLLGWPNALPGALVVVQLPWIVHACRLRNQAAAAPVDRIIFILGFWSCAQAVGLAFARAGTEVDFVSRYGDLLLVGVLAGGAALARLVQVTGRGRLLSLAAVAVWGSLITGGLLARSTGGHARYFHLTSEQSCQLRRDAVQAYLKNGDKHLLEAKETRWVLLQNPEVVTALLDRPAFRALLPATVNPANLPDPAGRLVRALQAHWAWLALPALLVLAAGAAWWVWFGPGEFQPPLAPRADPWPGRVALAVGLASLAGLWAWPSQFTFGTLQRWREQFGRDTPVAGLTFEITTPTEFGAERLQGAAPIAPAELRNLFFGTAVDGPAFTGTVVSSPFVLSKPWLVVPYSGHPVAHGNGLRLRLLDAQGGTVGDEIGCPGPNRETLGYWSVDVGKFIGQRARLVLYDGRTDTDAWVAAAPPIPTEDAGLVARLSDNISGEQFLSLRKSLVMTSLAAFLCAVMAWWNRP